MKVVTPLTKRMLYGLVNRTKPQPDIAFVLGTSAKEVWEYAVESALLGTGHTKASLQKLGWGAEPIIVTY